MYVAEGIPEEFALLRQELGRVSDSRFARGLVHPLEAVLSLAVLGLICGQCSLSAIYSFGDTHPELLAGLGLRRSPSAAALLQMVKVAEVRQAMLNFIVVSRVRIALLMEVVGRGMAALLLMVARMGAYPFSHVLSRLPYPPSRFFGRRCCAGEKRRARI